MLLDAPEENAFLFYLPWPPVFLGSWSFLHLQIQELFFIMRDTEEKGRGERMKLKMGYKSNIQSLSKPGAAGHM